MPSAAQYPPGNGEAYFLRRFLDLASDRGYDYYLMEPSTSRETDPVEGAVGAYWGILTHRPGPGSALRANLNASRLVPVCRVGGGAGCYPGDAGHAQDARNERAGLSRGGLATGVMASAALAIYDTWSVEYLDWGILVSAALVIPPCCVRRSCCLPKPSSSPSASGASGNATDSPAPDGSFPFLSTCPPTTNHP